MRRVTGRRTIANFLSQDRGGKALNNQNNNVNIVNKYIWQLICEWTHQLVLSSKLLLSDQLETSSNDVSITQSQRLSENQPIRQCDCEAMCAKNVNKYNDALRNPNMILRDILWGSESALELTFRNSSGPCWHINPILRPWTYAPKD